MWVRPRQVEPQAWVSREEGEEGAVHGDGPGGVPHPRVGLGVLGGTGGGAVVGRLLMVMWDRAWWASGAVPRLMVQSSPPPTTSAAKPHEEGSGEG